MSFASGPASDQDRAIEFYVGTLGFDLQSDVTFADGKMRWIEVAPAGSSTPIALTPPMEGGPTAVDTGIILSTSDIDADHATLKAAGVDVDPEVARWGAPVPPMFRLRDPGGNALRSSSRSTEHHERAARSVSPRSRAASPGVRSLAA
jgi:catechol 2,3-dioxygenase-like lactoylglutathione lyase family enzyme